MIMRLDLESAGPAITDVDNAGILTGPLQHTAAARGQAFQVDARGFVGAVLAPHHAEDAKLGKCRLASAEKLLDLFVLIEREAVLPEGLRGKCKCRGRSHGQVNLLSHFGAQEDREYYYGKPRAGEAEFQR